MSLGAWKAAATTCAHPERYAAAALVTVEVFPGTCEPSAVVAFHGTADPVAAYGEGGSQAVPGGPNEGITGARDNIAAWAENGGCAPDPELVPVGDDVEERRYAGCDEGIDVSLYSVAGGGHTWPGSDVVIGPPEMTTATIDATEILLDFFQAHPRPS
jgi:polyhydroxybutyrate depolymerase